MCGDATVDWKRFEQDLMDHDSDIDDVGFVDWRRRRCRNFVLETFWKLAMCISCGFFAQFQPMIIALNEVLTFAVKLIRTKDISTRN